MYKPTPFFPRLKLDMSFQIFWMKKKRVLFSYIYKICWKEVGTVRIQSYNLSREINFPFWCNIYETSNWEIANLVLAMVKD